jgi:Fe-S-cluster containining protein
MRDGLSLRALKRVVLFSHRFELWLRRTWLKRSGQPRYKLLNSCNGCGRCCELPSIQLERFAWTVPSLRAAIVWWQRVVNGMALVSSDPRFRLLVFTCSHYDRVTKRCDSYDSRPHFCRDYPLNLTFDPVPQLFDECSHRIVDRNAAALRKALEDAGLPPDKLAAARKRLYLDEE